MGGYTSLVDLAAVLRWLVLWLGWLVVIGLVCAGACWSCRLIGAGSWRRSGPPARPWRRLRLRAEASRGIEQIEDFLGGVTPR